MSQLTDKKERFERRRNRSRGNNRNQFGRMRMVVSRSNKQISVQIIDDVKGHTLVAVSSLEKSMQTQLKNITGKIEISKLVGQELASRAMEKKIENVYFDRNGYPYHGRVKALADGARQGGLKF